VTVASFAWGAPDEEGKYLEVVTRFADTLLEYGRDQYGPQPTALWAGVINTEDYSVPPWSTDVPALPGIRDSDRAVGGSNLYHDLATLHTLRVLSALTGDARYEEAVRAYVEDALRLTQSPETGLLAWGEHLYYHLYLDTVMEDREWHEFLSATPPWALLWEADEEATVRAIAGLRYHFFGEEPPSFLFNRHAYWDRTVYQQEEESQPWIKHSGLQALSFAFLHARTGDETWRRWALGTGSLYWEARNEETNLTPSAIGDPRERSSYASTGELSLLAYWLLKAAEVNPELGVLRTYAEAFMEALEKHARTDGGYFAHLALDGSPRSGLLEPWVVAYGESSLLPFGRVAAYFAKVTGEARHLETARRVAELTRQTPVPEAAPIKAPAVALNLHLDLYDLTGEARYLEDARRLADLGIARYGRGGLLTRVANDPFYEAKLGAGEFLAGLLRLHLRLHPEMEDPELYDWTF